MAAAADQVTGRGAMAMKTMVFVLACVACISGLLGNMLQVVQDQVPALISWVAAAFDVRDCTMTALTAWILCREGALS